MLFPTTIFAIFFAAVYIIHWTLPERSALRKYALLFSSIFFYGYWHWGFAAMMVVSAIVNHCFAVTIYRRDPTNRSRILTLAVAINLLLLAFFKYTGFLYTEFVMPLAVPLLSAFGASDALAAFNERTLPLISEIVLPVGISFYTFQAIAYVVDTAKDKCRPAKSCIDFINYLAFFPKLAAGPIARPGDLLPQMETLPSHTKVIDTGKATFLIIGGLFKKTVIANWLSVNIVDDFFQFPEDYSAIDAIIATYGYTIQIYCDFSAYSDIATGCALLLGFNLPENFRAPYIATTLQDFWRRWHISLSSWLRDYLYIPLGGSRKGTLCTYRNLVLTMLLGGLWHGAGWVYIIWGAIHGVAQVIERPISKFRPKNIVTNLISGIITFHVVAFAWIFFRSGAADAEGITTVKKIFEAFTRPCSPYDPEITSEFLSVKAGVILLIGFALQIFDGNTLSFLHKALNKIPPVLRALIAAILLTLVLGLGPAGVAPFIYFQF